MQSQAAAAEIHSHKNKNKKMKKKYRIEYEREHCIGAASCVTLLPAFWSLAQDGKATPKQGIEKQKKYVTELELDEEELREHLEAGQSCPVNVIHIYSLENGEQII